ncbi:hypothetical protein C8R45DRAFT_1154919 [Mycena sanguinolenta]|nr:hypothetical protein C8R45DRAFT_1154919 [Mycena sanguinolenta]
MTNFASFILIAAAALRLVTAAFIPRDDRRFSCLAPFGKLSGLALADANATVTSAEKALDNWLTEFCAVPSCSTDILNQVASITSGCSDFNGTQFATEYAGTRELFCLKDTTNNTFCATEAFSSDNSTDTTDNTSSTPDTTNVEEVLFALALASSGLGTCTECTKAQYQVAVKFGQTDSSGYESQCGANFAATLNNTATGIEQTAVTSKSGSKNGAGAAMPTSLLILLAVSGFWAFLS